MSLITTTFLSLIFACFASAFESDNVVAADNPDWNYDNHGTDWEMGSCGLREAANYQSPWGSIPADGTGINLWSSFDANVSFLTAWKNATIAEGDYGVTNYTYRINATDGNMGLFYAVDPYYANAQIVWEVEQIRFKYPPEHTFEGEEYDLEMQIVMKDILERSIFCFAHMGALSLFFKTGTETGTFFTDFFDGDEKLINLDNIFTKTTSMENLMFGYIGSSSEPNCEQQYCWYLNYASTALTISEEHLAAIKSSAVAWNNRADNLITTKPSFAFQMPGIFYGEEQANIEL